MCFSSYQHVKSLILHKPLFTLNEDKFCKLSIDKKATFRDIYFFVTSFDFFYYTHFYASLCEPTTYWRLFFFSPFLFCIFSLVRAIYDAFFCAIFINISINIISKRISRRNVQKFTFIMFT